MRSASRTVVKSPPELWELIDQPERMQGLMSSLLGYATEVEIYERDPGAYLGWESREQGDQNWIEVEIGEKGWGTEVKVTAECARHEPTKLEGWLEAVMDELAVPTKRPFDGMV
jgi:hypothetical protein